MPRLTPIENPTPEQIAADEKQAVLGLRMLIVFPIGLTLLIMRDGIQPLDFTSVILGLPLVFSLLGEMKEKRKKS